MARAATTEDEFTGLAKPARRALASVGASTLADLTTRNATDMAALHGVGPRGVAILREKLAVRGLTFADD
jgi:hypothetical protein